jgi:small neutral amino acid transporter SnatA (MarC family)
MSQAFYPLTFPLSVGPCMIVVVLTLSAHAAGHDGQTSRLTHAGIFVAAILLAVRGFSAAHMRPRSAGCNHVTRSAVCSD